MSQFTGVPFTVPLCTASVTLGLSVFQYPVFMSFLHARPSIAGRPLSRYWATKERLQGLIILLGFALTTTVSGAVAWRSLRKASTVYPFLKSSSNYFGIGALFALSHVAFMPLVAAPIKRMADGADSPEVDHQVDHTYDWQLEQLIEERNRNDQIAWFKWHTVRTLMFDVPALYCFARGSSILTP